MATSQFTYYSSSDAGAPVLTGQVGTLINVLRACLVTGYTGKPAAGWTEPITGGTNVAAFKQGAGSCGFFLYVNDTNVGGVYVARLTGWENVTALDAPVGIGSGQFPLAAQSLTDGHLCLYKNSADTAVAIPWRIYADSRTAHILVSYSYAGTNSGLFTSFGDIYALNSQDSYRCLLIASDSNSYSSSYASAWSGYTTTCDGHYMPRTQGGAGSSRKVGKSAPGTQFFYHSAAAAGYLVGYMQCPNPADSSIWINPLYVTETNGVIAGIRGRIRGLWTTPHNYANFLDGQVIQGAGDLASKTFQCVCPVGYSNACVFFIETSATVETN